ncbi:hypothetical protein ACWGR4_15785 [Embleya sp. NPDC055664]|uniref:hypothetical protein n=1 Tax=Embleya sp. MST-111070 TaxID=3398231 RepID=UPI003F741920
MDEHTERTDTDAGWPDNEGGRLFVTSMDDVVYTLPATIASIRASLPADEHDAFTKAIEDTPARELPLALYHWAEKHTPIPEARERTHDWVQEIYEEAEADTIMGVPRAAVLDQVESRLREGPPKAHE